MKKKSFKIALLVVVAAVAGYGAYQAQAQNNGLSEIALANAEALASFENGEFEYPTGQPYVYTCGANRGKFQHCNTKVITCQGGGSGCNSRKCPDHG